MKLLFINANLYGHINPTLALVEELVRRGNQVGYFCSNKFEDTIRRTGAEFIDFSKELDDFLTQYRPTDRHPFFMLMEYVLQYDEAMLPGVLSMIKKNQYDAIICDSIFGGAYFIQQILNIPVICSHSSFAMSKAPVPQRMLEPGFHPQLDHCYQVLHRICEAYDIPKPGLDQLFVSKGNLNIAYTTKEFNGDENLEDGSYLFLGPSIHRQEVAEKLDLSIAGDRKIIYISLGSLNTDFIEFYQLCMKAFRETEYFVVMSIGRKCEVAQLGEIPSNFMVQNYLPQLEVLKRASAFITHAGFNSVNESLYYGVPMLALPMVNDQHMVAKRLVSMNLGVAAEMKELTPELLRDQVAMLLNENEIKRNCAHSSDQMKTSVKYEELVNQIEKFSFSNKKLEI